MLPKNSDRNWEAYGQTNPYFGVISEDRFHTERIDATALSEFFLSGEAHVDQVLSTIHRVIDPEFSPKRCLDFGCGVGRLAMPLARRCQQVVGVDVSQAMLDEASKNAQAEGITNLELVRSDDELSRVSGSFDLIHSFIVLQHIPRKRGERFLQRFLELLAPGGVGALQFTYCDDLPTGLRVQRWFRESLPLVHNILNLVKGRSFSHPYMMMEDYDLGRLLRIIQERGCTDVHLELTKHSYFFGAMIYFRMPAGGGRSAA